MQTLQLKLTCLANIHHATLTLQSFLMKMVTQFSTLMHKLLPTQPLLQFAQLKLHPTSKTLALSVQKDPLDQQLVTCSFLPVSGLRGHALFNAFLNFCGNNERHAVLVSRAFVSQNITLQGEMLAVRQVKFIPRLNSLDQAIHRTNAFPFSLHLLLSWVYFEKLLFTHSFA